MTEKLYTAEQVQKALKGYLDTHILPTTMPAVVLANLDLQSEGHEARTLRYRVKQLGKELGRTGARLYDARCQLAEARACNQIDPTGYRGLLARCREAEARVAEYEEAIRDTEMSRA